MTAPRAEAAAFNEQVQSERAAKFVAEAEAKSMEIRLQESSKQMEMERQAAKQVGALGEGGGCIAWM